MSKLRVYELAKELEKTSKEVLSMLKDKGIEVASHSSTLSEEQIEVVKKAVSPKKEAPVGEEPDKAEKKNPVKEEAGTEKAVEAPKKKKIVQVFRPQNGARQGRGQAQRGGARPQGQAGRTEMPAMRP